MSTSSTKLAISDRKNFRMRIKSTAYALLLTLISNISYAQISTTIGFDDLLDGTAVTNQYQSLGVTISGLTVLDAPLNGITPHSMRNVAYAGTGSMVFNFSIADIKTVSAYVSGPVDVGIYAYDASNNLLGQALLPLNAPVNTLLSVTSSDSPIAKVEIHDGGASFVIDDFTFITAPPTEPICRVKDKALYDSVYTLPLSAFKCSGSIAQSAKNRILKEIVYFENLRAANAGQKKLLNALAVIKSDIRLNIKSADAAPLLSLVDQLISLTKAGSCAL